MARDVAPVDRRVRHVHGDGRPFSRAPMAKRAYVSRKEIKEVIDRIDPIIRFSGEMSSAATVDGITLAIADYLGPQLLALKHVDHATALKSISDLARDTAKIAQLLERLDQDYLLLLEDCRREPHDALDPDKFDLLDLHKKLVRLGHAAVRARGKLEPRKRGAPVNEGLYEIVARLKAIFDRAALPVIVTESGSRPNRRKVSGAGGVLLLALFRKFDRHTTEAQLWGAIHRALSRDPTSAG